MLPTFKESVNDKFTKHMKKKFRFNFCLFNYPNILYLCTSDNIDTKRYFFKTICFILYKNHECFAFDLLPDECSKESCCFQVQQQ